MFRIVLIIQARMGSTRLPGKTILPLAGEPLLSRIIERLHRCRKLSDIVLAIPDSPENDILAEIAAQNNTECFRGSEDDLIERYYQTASYMQADFIVRFPADNPIPEPSEIDRIIDHHLKLKRPGFSTNIQQIYRSGYPNGVGAEIFDFHLLKEVRNSALTDSQREHIHLNFFNYENETPVNNKWCPVSTVTCPEQIKKPSLCLDVNTQLQYEFISRIYDYLYLKNKYFTVEDVIRFLNSNC